MYNKKAVIAGIVVFLVICTAPFWTNFGAKYSKPEVVLPTDSNECVESPEFMRAEHMQLLNEWRDQALRNDNREYISKTTGKKWEISLQNTCLKCHNDYEQFCDKCHVTNNVDPYCWTCHILPKGSK